MFPNIINLNKKQSWIMIIKNLLKKLKIIKNKEIDYAQILNSLIKISLSIQW
jgi:hypothetical protein